MVVVVVVVVEIVCYLSIQRIVIVVDELVSLKGILHTKERYII